MHVVNEQQEDTEEFERGRDEASEKDRDTGVPLETHRPT